MVYAEYHFPSDKLGKTVNVHVLLPRQRNLLCPAPIPGRTKQSAGGYRCLWFLHGLGDDGRAVLLNSGLGELCDQKELAVILPDVENSFCLDSGPEALYRSYLLEELFPWTLENLPLSPRREDHFLGGISMGGYGACVLGLERPELFSRLLILSGAFDLAAALRYARLCRIPTPPGLLSPQFSAAETIPSLLAEQGDSRHAPALYFVCGKRDLFRRGVTAFAERCRALGYSAELHLEEGKHDWMFWRSALPPAIDWALRPL